MTPSAPLIFDRDQFPITRQWAFFNHASVAPLTRAASERMRAWADDMSNNGSVHGAQWWSEIDEVRATAARLINGKPSQIAFLNHTSHGLSQVAEGFPWNPGDNLVMVEGEFPANVYPWMHLQSRGVELRRVAPGPMGRFTADDVAHLIDARTRLLTVSQVQFSNGFRADLEALGELCDRRGVDFCVDAIQGLGVLPIDVERMKIDFLAADGHKWLLGPEGAAIFYVRQAKLERLRPVTVGWHSVVNSSDYSNIDFRFKQSASRFEGGSHNVVGILALGASLNILDSLGIPAIGERVKTITDALIERLLREGAEIHSARSECEWSGIVSFSIGQESQLRLLHQAKDRGVILAHRAGRLRASPHFYTSDEDIDRLVEAVKPPRLVSST